MGKHYFTESERVALWTADDRKCFYERIPVRYNDLHIDHIVPESTSQTEFAALRSRLSLPDSFQINSIENWVTCHQGCNLRKQSKVFEDNALVFFLELAKKRAAKVQEIMKDLSRARENDKFLSGLATRLEQGHLTRDEVLTVMRKVSTPVSKTDDPWVISFGVNLYDSLPLNAPERDPELSDWLIEQLNHDLASTGAIFHIIDDARSGETTSVRCAFWVFDFDRVQDAIHECWEVLEVQKYSELFGSAPDKLLTQAVVGSYRATVWDSTDPVGPSVCTVCGSANLETGIQRRHLKSADAIIAESCRELAYELGLQITSYLCDEKLYKTLSNLTAYSSAVNLRFVQP